MQVTHLDLEDVHCVVTFSDSSSPLSLSLTSTEVATPRLGTMVYAVPRGSGAVTSTLVANREFEEQTVLVAKLAASKFQRPIFLNSSVEKSAFVYKKIIDAVGDVLA